MMPIDTIVIWHNKIDDHDLYSLLRSGELTLGGNVRLKIFGRLGCVSGKRMKRENRVFFKNQTEAIASGFRPCGHCMPEEYKVWEMNMRLTLR